MTEQKTHPNHPNGEAMTLSPVDQLTIPWGGQEIQVQQVDFASGGMPLLRVRIREGRRFTIFDIDAVSAQQWGRAMADWAEATLATHGDGPA